MATNLDLDEQEQLDNLKHYWKRYGNLITLVLVLVLGGFAAWNGYQFWQQRQALGASALFDEVQRAASAQETDRMVRAFDDLRAKYGSTAYATQGALLVARAHYERANTDGARAALTWAAAEASDTGLRALAKLRLASLMVEAKQYDEALAQISGDQPAEFAALVADRRGDILLLQGKRDEARDAFQVALKALDARSDYRRVVEVKLNSLGVDVSTLTPPPAQPAK